VAKGGETYFPYYDRDFIQTHRLSDCDSPTLAGGLRSPPKEGSVIMFYSLLPNGDLDDKSLHGSCAVKDGVKWGANKWIWNTPRI
jgi:prolyl 4-hydroxylase